MMVANYYKILVHWSVRNSGRSADPRPTTLVSGLKHFRVVSPSDLQLLNNFGKVIMNRAYNF